MESTVIAESPTRRAAELAVEHIVQDCGVPGGDVFVQPAGAANTTGDRPTGADAKAAPMPKQGGMLESPIVQIMEKPAIRDRDGSKASVRSSLAPIAASGARSQSRSPARAPTS